MELQHRTQAQHLNLGNQMYCFTHKSGLLGEGGPDGLIFWKHCCILRKYNMQREIYQVLPVRLFLIGLTVEDRSYSFDEAYWKIVRVLKTGLAGICCVYKQSASVCASCVRIGGGWGMGGGARYRKSDSH